MGEQRVQFGVVFVEFVFILVVLVFVVVGRIFGRRRLVRRRRFVGKLVMRRIVFAAIILLPLPATGQTTEPPIEQVSLGASLVMLGFLLLAALIVISVLCQILIVVGLVPEKGAIRSVMFWLSRVVSGVRVTRGTDSGSRSTGKGGGGSYGGGGSSGNW